MNSIPKILILPEYGADRAWHGSAYIRLLRPLEHPEVLGGRAVFEVRHAFSSQFGADIVVVERNWRPDIDIRIAEGLIGEVRRAGAKLWWTLDDNLFDQHPVQQTEANLSELRPVARLFAREADAVLVSTDALARRVSRIARRCVVLPNLLDERLFGELPRPDVQASVKRIGYLGTFTHGPDLASIMPALAEALSRHEDWGFELLGVTSAVNLIPRAVASRMRVIGNYPAPYPEFLPWIAGNLKWSIGIAPLLPGEFNDCKSDIKLLDLGVIGSAGACADLPAYAATARAAGTSHAAAGDVEGWLGMLDALMADRDLRIHHARKLREYLLGCRTLRAAGAMWRAELSKVL